MSMRSVMRYCTTLSAFVLFLGFSSRATADAICVNEVQFDPLPGAPQWVELLNRSDAPINLAAAIATDEDGNDYEIPVLLPDVPPGAFVVIHFDGLGAAADDYDFGDNVANLHSEPLIIDPFDVGGDQTALYSGLPLTSDNMLAFLAWGTPPGAQAANAVDAGLWPDDQFLPNVAGGGEPLEGPGYATGTGGSIGLPPDTQEIRVESYVGYTEPDVTQGLPNLPPRPAQYLPPEGFASDTNDFAFSWIEIDGSQRYQFQIATDANFTNLVVNEPNVPADQGSFMPGPLPDGDLYWRVRAIDAGGVPGVWSNVRNLFIGFPIDGANQQFDPAPNHKPPHQARAGGSTVSGTVRDARSNNPLGGVTVTIGEQDTITAANGTWSITGVANGAHTVTASLMNYANNSVNINVTGDTPGVNINLTGNSSVIGVAPLAARKDGPLLCLDGNCQRTNANNYAWDNTHTGRANPGTHENWYCTPTAATMMARNYGGTVTIEECANAIWGGDAAPEGDLGHGQCHSVTQIRNSLTFSLQTNLGNLNEMVAKPSAAQMVTWINANRPSRYSTGPHAMVIDGFRWVDKRLQVRYLNTDNNGTVAWVFWNGAGSVAFSRIYVPNTGLTGRNRDPRIGTAAAPVDADADGITDFDEQTRFPTSRTNADTDGDKVNDKNDIASYRFRAVNRNIDGDNIRPEADPDSDGDGCKDGDEDSDHNGVFDVLLGESDVYDPTDVGPAGDLDLDCDVDADDYLIFLLTMGSSFGDPEYLADADYDFDLSITLVDYQYWHFFYLHYAQNNTD